MENRRVNTRHTIDYKVQLAKFPRSLLAVDVVRIILISMALSGCSLAALASSDSLPAPMSSLPVPSLTSQPPQLPSALPSPGDTQSQANAAVQRAIQATTESRQPSTEQQLPTPDISKVPPQTLSLRDAILLALRYNQNVQESELQRISDKYALALAYNQFQPQYTLGGTSTFAPPQTGSYTVNGGVSIESTMGTKYSVNYDNTLSKGIPGTFGSLAFSVDQPLIQGFGFVNKIPLLDAQDSELVARLTLKDNIINDVVGVITAYRSLVENYQTLAVQKRTLDEQKKTVQQYQLEVKVGSAAPSDLRQQQATLATTQLSYVQTQNAIQQSYFSFLTSLGLAPTANLKIDQTIDYENVKVPDQKTAIELALKNNISYQQALITLRSTKRAIYTAEDARKWLLDLNATHTLSGINTAGLTPGTSNVSPSTSVMLTLNVPIDDMSAKVNYEDMKIAYEQAKLSLENQKNQLVTSVITQLKQVESDKQQIAISIQSVQLQQATFEDSKIQRQYGKATDFQVTTEQDTLLSEETSLVSTEIAYLNDVTTLNQLLGITLDEWDIKLRY